jgi:predicted alpha/beta hydrolase family esterase
MASTVLIIPGFHGSSSGHWQTWLQSRLPDSRRLNGVDWERPVLSEWVRAINLHIDDSPGNVWIVAHSFGCLAAVAAAAERADKVAGALLVAPANPRRFTPSGFSGTDLSSQPGNLAEFLPYRHLPLMGLVVASLNDPWLGFEETQYWARRWGFALYNAGKVGHINVESGHGPWALVQELLRTMRSAAESLPIGHIQHGDLSAHARIHSCSGIVHGNSRHAAELSYSIRQI